MENTKKTNLYKDVSLPIQYVSEMPIGLLKLLERTLKEEIDTINPANLK